MKNKKKSNLKKMYVKISQGRKDPVNEEVKKEEENKNCGGSEKKKRKKQKKKNSDSSRNGMRGNGGERRRDGVGEKVGVAYLSYLRFLVFPLPRLFYSNHSPASSLTFPSSVPLPFPLLFSPRMTFYPFSRPPKIIRS